MNALSATTPDRGLPALFTRFVPTHYLRSPDVLTEVTRIYGLTEATPFSIGESA